MIKRWTIDAGEDVPTQEDVRTKNSSNIIYLDNWPVNFQNVIDIGIQAYLLRLKKSKMEFLY